ncbi:BLUF domain-containing protein [Roseomonas sp. BN140053]|uniref:BLUF domain-containing protein n=1 Tax=Roseomonas sp. BN140053 TaxID=3391898 RepID=UPI0039E9BD26
MLRVVYLSRSHLPPDKTAAAAELGSILEASRRNNAQAGVTGALLFTGELFAQVLEGPFAAAEAAFNRIQRDPRHSDIVVLHRGTPGAAAFDGWSMASAAAPPGIAVHPALSPPAGSGGEAAGDAIIALLRALLLRTPKGAGSRLPDGEATAAEELVRP